MALQLTEAEMVRRARSRRIIGSAGGGGEDGAPLPRSDDGGGDDGAGDSVASSGDRSFPPTLRAAALKVTRRVEAGARRSVSHWKVLAFGQVLSVLRFVIGASATVLYRTCGLSAPATQTGVAYCLLAVFHGLCFLYPAACGWGGGTEKANEKGGGGGGAGEAANGEAGPGAVSVDGAPSQKKARRGRFPVALHAPLRTYLLIALLHVEGNYLVFLSFRFTTFTSITLFINLAVPSAMVFSKILLRRRYRAAHIVGVIVCLVGVFLNVWVDYGEQRMHRAETGADDQDSEDEFGEAAHEDYPRRILGDALAIVGGLMFGMNDVLFERAVRTYGGGPREFLPALGLFGAVISTVQVLLFELGDLAKFARAETGGERVASQTLEVAPIVTPSMSDEPPACTRRQSLSLLLAGCSLSTYLFVAGVAHFLTASESALLNLSYLTEDWWSVIFSVLAVGYAPRPLFYLALVLVLTGVFIYETGPSPADPDGEGEDEGGRGAGAAGARADDGLGEVAAGRFTGAAPKDLESRRSSDGGDSSFGDEGVVSGGAGEELPEIT